MDIEWAKDGVTGELFIVQARPETGQELIVSCAEGDDGLVYEGLRPFHVEKLGLKDLKRPKTKIMMNLGNPVVLTKQCRFGNTAISCFINA